MAELINQTKNQPIIKNLRIATSFSTRSKGFIGRKNLDTQEGLWFPQCNWIHTFFMSIPIDVVYLDKKMKVRKVQKNLKPWRFPAPVRPPAP